MRKVRLREVTNLAQGGEGCYVRPGLRERESPHPVLDLTQASQRPHSHPTRSLRTINIC